MRFFQSLNRIFGMDNDGGSDLDWKKVSSKENLSEIIKASGQKPQVIYKHSTRCATSFFALKNIQGLSEETKEKAEFYIVDVIKQRELSYFIAERFGIKHESPQVFILRNGDVLWNGSHHEVNAESLQTYI
ncbi:MAG TPA: bacillithiol system redox-active protein YtxJ [Gracilimonas sp.]|uniref:bacillithiol system redox-active protein YtxJ n=1 Tax=Gracilimonas sp. TaxID=1974203 RepID=UPI002D8EB1BC|nr:bacillithiol system redox-active protein YtxJ [Gracilimonas sp.]